MLFSQAQNMAFEDFKTNDGTQNFFYKNIVKTDASGNIYTLGATTTSNSTTDILLTKKNSSGVSLWSKQINGTANYHDFGSGLAITSSGDVYITGAITNNTTTLAPELIIRKYNSSGSQQFSTTYSGAGYGCVGKDIVVDGSGNSYITGAEYNSGFNADILTIAFGSTGTQIWTDLFDNNSLNDGGVKIGFRSNKVTVTGAVTQSTNNYKIATLTFTASTGVRSETITLGSTMTSSVEIVTGMTTDASGNTYICGATEVSGQGFNMYVAKLTSSLTIAWQQTYNGVSNLDDQAKGIQVDGSGNVYITGYSTSSTLGKEIRTIKYNSSGTLQWNNVINSTGNSPDQAFDMEMDASSNIYVCGSISSDINQLDYYTVKYNSSGTKIWDIQTDGNHLNDQATNLAIDILNNVIVTGESETAPGTYVYSTCKYIQKDIITPTDFNGETPAVNFMYYPNKGQLINTSDTLIPEVKYYTNNTYPQFYFKNNSQSFVFSSIDTISSTNDTLHRIDLKFNNVVESSKTYSMEKQDMGYLNYYLGHLDSNGVTKICANNRLITPNIYANIDLMCSSNQNGIKYYFIVKPGGDMRDIKMEFTGATSFSLNGTTNALSINSSIGSLTFDRPTAYQLTTGNATVAVTSWTPAWQTNGASNKYTFNSASYTSSLTLIIQIDQGNSTSSAAAIQNLTWSTFYGGTSDDVFYDVKTNNSNNVWVTGNSKSINFPTSSGSFQSTNAGNTDAIFVKFSDTGARLWATYIGGSLDDTNYNIHGIEVDNNGNSYSAFRTSSTNFPMNNSGLVGAYFDNLNTTTSPSSPEDLAIVSLNNLGQLTWSTYFGGNGWYANSYDIGLDNNNNLFVTGLDQGIPLVTPSGSYSSPFTIFSGGAYFIAKFNSNHNLIWSSYFGENGPRIEKIAFTSSNDIVIVGGVNNQSGANFDDKDPGGGAYFDNTFNDDLDAFIAKFDGTTNDLTWSTLYGGDKHDFFHAVTVDNNNNIYVSGNTVSSSAAVTGNAFGYSNTSFGGIGSYASSQTEGDAILVKFNSSNQITSSTYFGGASNEGSFDIAFKNNRLFIPFVTAGDDIPFYGSNPSTAFVQANNSDGQDVSNDGFFAVMDDDFNFQWSSYFGGTNTGVESTRDDQIFSNACSNNNKYYIVGGTKSAIGFPLVNPGSSAYFQGTKSSSLDAFIAQFDIQTSLVSLKEIKENLNSSLIIYPNPANNILNIQFKDKLKYNIHILDIFGRVVKSLENQSVSNINIDISNLANGTYIVKAFNKDETAVQKLIIN